MRRKVRKFLPSVLVGFVLGILLQLIWPFVFYQSEAEKLQEFLLSQDTIYWQVESSRAVDERTINMIHSALNSDQGWSRAGITFEPSPLSEASIIFVIHDHWDKTEEVCRVSTDGCVKREAHLCKVVLLETSLSHQGYATSLINHEMGHCLGLPHGKDGVMKQADKNNIYPNESEIARIHTLRERFHSPN